MKIDGGIGFSINGMADAARQAEASGYDGVWSAETSHDPFLPIAVGAGATTSGGNLDYGSTAALTLNGGTTQIAFGIQTFCQGATTTAASLPFNFRGNYGWPLVILAFVGMLWTLKRNRRLALTFAMLMLMTLGSAACASLPKGPNGATPAGTYSLTLTTTVNGQTQTLPNFLTLVVK